jgi:phenylacetic acid degradation operon negative regulatory protein
LLGFSLPEAWQRQRHDLRSQLAWAGFGPLQGGRWIAPGRVDVSAVVAELGLATRVRVFRAHADELTDVDQLVHDAYDLDRLAERYREFIDRWSDPPYRDDPLAAHLAVVTEWLRIIRTDPRLPVRHLPADWPVIPAQKTFQHLEAELATPAAEAVAPVFESIPDETGQVSPPAW